jgi:hypothetical protein
VDRDAETLVPKTVEVDETERAALHIDLVDLPDQESDGLPSPYARLVDLIDAFIAAYNAHDLDRCLGLLARDVDLPGLGGDRDGFADAVARCWDGRPHALLTRGHLPQPYAGQDGWEEHPVAVLWDVPETDGWQRVALFDFDLSDGDDEIGLVELVGDVTILDEASAEAPDPDIPEGARWIEWDEGADTGA